MYTVVVHVLVRAVHVHVHLHGVHIVVVVPDTGGTRYMVECPQCLGLQVFCSLLPSGSIAPPP